MNETFHIGLRDSRFYERLLATFTPNDKREQEFAPHVTKFFPLLDVYYSLLSEPTIDVSPYQLRPLAVSIIAKVLNVAKEYLE